MEEPTVHLFFQNIRSERVKKSKFNIFINTKKVSINDRSFLYGDGLFETILVRDGKIYYLKDHYSRLKKGSKLLKILIPDFKSTESSIKKCINNTCFFNTQREKKIVLFGDSHAGSLSFGLKEYFDNSEYQFVTKFNNCFNFRGIDQIHRRTKRIHPNCNIEKSNIDKIFFDKITNPETLRIRQRLKDLSLTEEYHFLSSN